jgi:hypothetical protein
MFRVNISSLVINLKKKKIRKNTCREIISIQTQNLNSSPKATLSCDHRYYCIFAMGFHCSVSRQCLAVGYWNYQP